MSMSQWLAKLRGESPTTRTTVRDMPVTVINSLEPHIDTADVLRRLDDACALIERYTPHYWRHLTRDFAGIIVERYACRGAYFFESRLCLVELTFTVNRAFTPAQIAATILHEGMHARLHALGFPLDMADRARQERFCRRAEIEFGRRVPDGDAVVARALETLTFDDDEVAPVIDEALAAERIREADHRRRTS